MELEQGEFYISCKNLSTFLRSLFLFLLPFPFPLGWSSSYPTEENFSSTHRRAKGAFAFVPNPSPDLYLVGRILLQTLLSLFASFLHPTAAVPVGGATMKNFPPSLAADFRRLQSQKDEEREQSRAPVPPPLPSFKPSSFPTHFPLCPIVLLAYTQAPRKYIFPDQTQICSCDGRYVSYTQYEELES